LLEKNAKKQNTILASSDMNLVYQIMTIDWQNLLQSRNYQLLLP